MLAIAETGYNLTAMTYELAIGDRTYSSWSLRGWLIFETFNLPVKTRSARMYSPEFKALVADFAPARLVPALKKPDGTVIYDTLAIAMEMQEAHPEIEFWPSDSKCRAFARSITAEMHSGFSALRDACVMNLRWRFEGFEPSDAVRSDLARLELLWSMAREMRTTDGPWLFGEWSMADVFYAPVATRIATCQLPVGQAAQDYVAAHLAAPAFRRWRAMGLAENYIQPGYDLDLPTSDWPGPAPIAAMALSNGTPENETCPYSGRPVKDLLEIDGRVFGFCNPFCRDKTLADPAVWPAFMEIYQK